MVARGARASPPTDRVTSIQFPTRTIAGRAAARVSSTTAGSSPHKRLGIGRTVSPSKTASTAQTTTVRSRYLSPSTAARGRQRATGIQEPTSLLSASRDAHHHHTRSSPHATSRLMASPHRHAEFRDDPPVRHLSQSNTHHDPPTYSSPTTNTSGEPTCDYDDGPTILHDYLESSHWEKARVRCRTHPIEVKTWIVRRDLRSHQIRWKLLPLHAAIIFQAPTYMISTLLEYYPNATSRPDDQGMLPLHLAFRHYQENSEQLLELLLQQYPAAVRVPDRRQRLALEHGRESQFSAKIVQLYADAAASQQGPRSPGGCTAGYHSDRPSAKDIAMIKAQLTAEHQTELANLRQQFATEMEEMRATHDRRLISMADENKNSLDEAHAQAAHERSAITAQHTDEMNEIRDLLTSQVRKDRMMRDALETEVNGLHTDLAEARHQMEHHGARYHRMKDHVREVHELLSALCEDHIELQELVSQQMVELEGAQTVRQELITTLMSNEGQEERNVRLRNIKVQDLSTQLRDKIERTLERNEYMKELELASNAVDAEAGEQPFDIRRTQSRHESANRLEESRAITRNEPVLRGEPFDPEGDELLVVEQGRDVIDYERGDDFLSKPREVAGEQTYRVEIGNEIASQALPSERKDAEAVKSRGEALEGRILADDISAITDNSEY